MTARRSARDHRPRPATVSHTVPGALPRVLAIGACVDVWLPGKKVDGTDREASEVFERASALCFQVERYVRGWGPNCSGLGPDAWSLDGRTRPAGRLRPLAVDSDGEDAGRARLAAAGLSLSDLPALMREARELIDASRPDSIIHTTTTGVLL